MRPGAGFRPVIRQALGGIRQADFSTYKSSLCKRRRRRWKDRAAFSAEPVKAVAGDEMLAF